MKLYCKIKIDGIWQWHVGDNPWKVATARALCECRVCRPGKPNFVSQEEKDLDEIEKHSALSQHLEEFREEEEQ